jgi:hypothetical protein
MKDCFSAKSRARSRFLSLPPSHARQRIYFDIKRNREEKREIFLAWMWLIIEPTPELA